MDGYLCALKDGYIDYGTCNTQYQTSVIRLSYFCSYHRRDLQILMLKNNNDFCTSHMRQYNFVVASNKLHPVLSNINFVSTSYSYLDEVNYSRQSFSFTFVFFFVLVFPLHFILYFEANDIMHAIYAFLWTLFPSITSIFPWIGKISQRRFNKTQQPIHGHHFSFCFTFCVGFFLLFFSQFIMKIIIFIDHTSSSAPPPIYLSISCSYFL